MTMLQFEVVCKHFEVVGRCNKQEGVMTVVMVLTLCHANKIYDIVDKCASCYNCVVCVCGICICVKMLVLQCLIFHTISHYRYVAKITDVVVCTYHIETLRNNSQYMILQLNNKTTNSKQQVLDLTNRFICGLSVVSSHTTFI